MYQDNKVVAKNMENLKFMKTSWKYHIKLRVGFKCWRDLDFKFLTECREVNPLATYTLSVEKYESDNFGQWMDGIL